MYNGRDNGDVKVKLTGYVDAKINLDAVRRCKEYANINVEMMQRRSQNGIILRTPMKRFENFERFTLILPPTWSLLLKQ